ncbi:MAG: type II toxin-antitoxin system VapC family toxin [Candidatus Leucobacter sulfamidivorax]|nr:type II toxin-antitoxin system VapC family toxin [Candidatus Leucobacter sulfamidivorax]MBL5974403.1 type II toxin-antitoxin system VapC family toxin [Candidatus Leucobacter sulfamidivorax]
MIVLDTNVVSALMRPDLDPAIARWIAEHDPSEFVLTAVTRAEIRYGIARLPAGQRRERLRHAADALFAAQAGRILPFDERAADLYGDIIAQREATGRPIGVLDAQIAAIARAHDAVIATRDTGGFADTGTAIVNPFEM